MQTIDEVARLQAVKRFDVLDSPPESDFDDLVKLASKLFQVPISTVTILDEHRQWFKSAVGLDVRETPKDISFCQHAIDVEEALIIENALVDARVNTSPLVLGDMHIRFYAGVPLRTSDDKTIGTFCLIDKKARTFSHDELASLKVIANLAMRLLELRAERKKLKESEALWKFALEGTGDGVWDWHIDTSAVIYSAQWKRMLGFTEHELSDSVNEWKSRVHQDDLIEMLNALEACLNNLTPYFNAEYRMLCKNGHYKWIMSRAIVVEWSEHHEPIRMVGTHADISERKKNEDLIWHQANFDTLTGLANRQMFFDRLHTEIKQSARRSACFAVLFIDLDGFKAINDNHGHDAGDMVLLEVSKRMIKAIRESDTAGRIGGDEFIILLSALENPSHAQMIADKLVSVLAVPYEAKGQLLHISASIGLAIYPTHGDHAEMLINKADAAMYAAKEAGKNCWKLSPV